MCLIGMRTTWNVGHTQPRFGDGPTIAQPAGRPEWRRLAFPGVLHHAAEWHNLRLANGGQRAAYVDAEGGEALGNAVAARNTGKLSKTHLPHGQQRGPVEMGKMLNSKANDELHCVHMR